MGWRCVMDNKMDGLSERLGRLEQEQARMNGMLETIRAGLSYRVERADAGDRVAESMLNRTSRRSDGRETFRRRGS